MVRRSSIVRQSGAAIAAVFLVSICAAGCGGKGSQGEQQDAALADGTVNPPDGTPGPDGGTDGTVVVPDGATDGTVPDPDGGSSNCAPPTGLTRGRQWVRNNPAFISGLIPGMGAPSLSNVNDYFDQFHATAIHFWEDGLPNNEASWAAHNHPNYRFVTWTHADGTSVVNGQVLGGNPNAPGRIGYQIGDEPADIAGWNAILVGVAAVRAADPNALIIANFSTTQPSAADLASMLAEAGALPAVDVLSYDLYTYTKGAYDPLERIRIAAKDHGKVYWRYLNSYHDPGQNDPPTLTDMRWDAFVGILYGYTGHSWFLYQVGPPHSNNLQTDLFATSGSYDAQKTQHFQWAAELNQQMAILLETTSLLESTDVRYVPSNSALQPDMTVNWSAGAGGDPYITSISATNSLHEFSVGFFTDDCDDIYVMIQNANHNHGNFPTVLDQAETITVNFDFSSATDPAFDKTAVDSLNKQTGAVETTTLTSTGGDTAQLVVTLEPGDVFFFKYRTGNPFARQ